MTVLLNILITAIIISYIYGVMVAAVLSPLYIAELKDSKKFSKFKLILIYLLLTLCSWLGYYYIAKYYGNT